MNRLICVLVITFVLTTASGQVNSKLGNTKNTKGKYVAFLVGANNYQVFNTLSYPIQDIEMLKETLKDYSFRQENMIVAEDPTENVFYERVKLLKQKVKNEDNLLIYVSLHGILNENGKYFWLPVDAKVSSTVGWIFVRDFLDVVESIDCRHVLIIIDSCFGGSLFSESNSKSGGFIPDAVITQQDIENYQENRSALAITSGARLHTVPDKSHFFKAINEKLKSNEYEYLPVSRLFEDARNEVYNIQNKSSFKGIKIQPQFSKITYLKDDGGQFVFHKPGGIARPLNTNHLTQAMSTSYKLPEADISGTREFEVGAAVHKETIALNAGDRLEVVANGTVTVGQFLGTVTPRGKEKGLFGVPIDEYDIVPKYPHGALMYRLGPDQPWILCGDGCLIKVTKSGIMNIEFSINDNNTGDNSGSFHVTLKKI